MRAGIYVRVSTVDKQNPEMQLNALQQYCRARNIEIADIYTDYTSGAKDRRPALDKIMDAAKKRQIDMVIVWKLDRFGRSLKHLVTALDELEGLGITFISYRENIDLSTPSGRLMFHIIASMAEFERELIRERVRAGVAHARAKGKRLGRKATAPIQRKKIIDAYSTEPWKSVREIAKATKMPVATTGRVIKAFRAGLLDRDGFEYEKALV
jgi:putative DNA-invertase from lambdoid prophage Rac